MTRTVFALAAGDWQRFLLYNPFTMPFIALHVWTGCELVAAWLKKKELSLSRRSAWLWLGVLGGAWVSKFVIGPQYW